MQALLLVLQVGRIPPARPAATHPPAQCSALHAHICGGISWGECAVGWVLLVPDVSLTTSLTQRTAGCPEETMNKCRHKQQPRHCLPLQHPPGLAVLARHKRCWPTKPCTPCWARCAELGIEVAPVPTATIHSACSCSARGCSTCRWQQPALLTVGWGKAEQVHIRYVRHPAGGAAEHLISSGAGGGQTGHAGGVTLLQRERQPAAGSSGSGSPGQRQWKVKLG